MKYINLLAKCLKFILPIFIFIFIWSIYEKNWLNKFNTHLLPFLDISSNFWLAATTMIFIIILVILLVKNFQNKYRITGYQRMFMLASCCIYVKYRFSGLYLYTYFVEPVAYLDIITAAALLLVIMEFICILINYHKVYTHKETKKEFIPDQPICSKDDDILDYNVEATRLAKKLNSIPLEHSWSIGVTSAWGTGKSSFLNLVENAIDSNSFIIINFNPRNTKDVQSIQEDFFSTLCAALKPYNSGFSTMFRSYMETLQLFDDKNIISTILSLQSMVDKKSAKEKISEALKELPKKVVIIIEDFDRLLADEIVEVFKLIDGNASFPNVIFLTAYDKNHVSKMINNKYIGEISPFSDKFFNLEVVVPIRPYRKIHSYLVDEILTRIQVSQEERKTYQAPLDAYTNILSQHLPTLRDVKRFINLFVYDFLPIKEEVYFQDFFLLTIIKYKDPSIYKKLFNKEYLETKDIGQYVLAAEYKDDSEHELPFRDILERLFPENTDSEQTYYRRIFSSKAFEIYFVTQTYDLLKKQEMQELLQKDFSLIQEQIDDWDKDHKTNDLIEFLSTRNILDFANKDIFISYAKIVFYLSLKQPHTEVYLLVISLIYTENVSEIIPHYGFSSIAEYTVFIKDILNSAPPYYSDITQKLIINHIDKEFNKNSIILSQDELLTINKQYLKQSISQRPVMDQLHMALLYSCISEIVPSTRKIILDSDSCHKIKELIENSPDYYISTFVRLGAITSNPSYNSIACEPFWASIFGNATSFEHFINGKELDSTEHIGRVRNFWRLYEKNNYTPINIEGEWNVQEQIDNNLEDLVSRLETLLTIRQEFEEKVKEQKLSPRPKDAEVYIKLYDGMINHVRNNKLPIALTSETLELIKNKLNRLKNTNK